MNCVRHTTNRIIAGLLALAIGTASWAPGAVAFRQPQNGTDAGW
jgi:hypothetical protein